jgi:quercetin dioxygenase-like cupin family protein
LRIAILLAPLLLSAPIASGQRMSVPVEQEPHHHVLLKNEFVIVIRATLQPSESTLYHKHSHDIADVELASSSTTEQMFGEKEGPVETSHTGDVSADSLDQPITHRVRNVGVGPMDILHVEFLQRPAQRSSRVAGPVAAENTSARVYNWIIAPGTSTPMHSHERPYLIVAATSMRLKMTAPDGRSLSEEVKPGDYHWVDAGITHTLANDGLAQGQIVEIELK